MYRIAISDIHGYGYLLERLYDKILSTYGDNVHIYFLGDYVDRGPDSGRSLNLVRRLVEQGVATALMGNHDWKLLRHLRYINRGEPSKIQTNEHLERTVEEIQRYMTLQDAQNFLEELPFFLDLTDIKLVHAFYSSSVASGSKSKRDVALYGPVSSSELEENGLPKRIPWWNTYDGRHGKVVFGHVHAGEIVKYEHCTCIDTSVDVTGILGAYNIDTREVLYVS